VNFVRASRPLLAAVFFVLVQVTGCEKPPRDEVLIKQFNAERESFNELLQLSRDYLSTHETLGVNEGGSEAQRLMKRLSVRYVYGTKDNVSFSRTGSQSASYDEKGFEFVSPEGGIPPSEDKIVDALDEIQLNENEIKYKRLDDGWYLYLSRSD